MGALLSGLLLAGSVSAQTGTTSPKTELVLAPSGSPQSLLSGKTPIRIEGQVTDVKGNPIEFATVFLAKNNACNSAYYDTGAVTEPDGFFSIELTDMDLVRLDISCIGYESQTLHLNLQKDRVLAENLKIALKPSHYQLQEVVVVAYNNDPRRHIKGGVCSIYRETGTKRVPVKKKKEEPIINVYPNPFVNHCQVDMMIPIAGAYLFSVYNAHEQLIFSETFQLANGRINVGFSLPDGLPAASYWLRITRGSELLCTKQLVKQ
ncbi:MAG: carboxypeptidase-like regulatory domain-containing protein [Saprospiraceae bacterium]|nr:carboxypeptidase-like regulatory domain-containing protein [Saprospiraceae bacterium]